MLVGEKIKFLRKQLGITQEELAIAVGTKKQTIHKYEMGIISNIPASKIKDIAEKLGTTPAYLMGWEEQEVLQMKPEIVQDISTRLKHAAKLRNISQAELSRVTGIDKGSISLYISGKYPPKSDKLYKLAMALNVNPVWLSGFDVPMTPFPQNENESTNITTKKLSTEREELIERLLNSPSDKAVVVMFGGDGPKVMEIPNEKADLAARLLGTLSEDES